MRLDTVFGKLHFFCMGTGGEPLAKPTERMEGGKREIDDHPVHRNVRSSSRSEEVKLGI